MWEPKPSCWFIKSADAPAWRTCESSWFNGNSWTSCWANSRWHPNDVWDILWLWRLTNHQQRLLLGLINHRWWSHLFFGVGIPNRWLHEMFILSNMMAHSSMWFFSGANKNLRVDTSTLYMWYVYVYIYIYIWYTVYTYIYICTHTYTVHTHTVYSTYGTSIYMLISRLYRVCVQLRKQGCPRFLQCLRHIQLRVDYDLVHGVDSLHKAVTCTDSDEGLSPDCCNCQRWQYVDWHAPSPSQIDSIR